MRRMNKIFQRTIVNIVLPINETVLLSTHNICFGCEIRKNNFLIRTLKAAYSVTKNIFSKIFYFLFKAFVKVELSYVFTIKMFSTAENCMEK